MHKRTSLIELTVLLSFLAQFKYDLDITNFDDKWWSANATALVLGYRISTMEPKGDKEAKNMSLSDLRIDNVAKRPVKPIKSDGTNGGTAERAAVDFGNGNGMEVVSTANEVDTGLKKVVVMTAITTPREGSFILTIYEKFKGGLRHDPSLFTASTSSTIDAKSNTIVVFGDAAPVPLTTEDMVAMGLAAANGTTLLSGAPSSALISLVSIATLAALATSLVLRDF